MNMKSFCSTAMLALLALSLASAAQAGVVINEIYFDPPGSSVETTAEYIELRGDASMSLANCYLIFLENENNALNTGDPGHIEAYFDLGSYSLGSNGFLTLRQKNSIHAAPATGTTDLINTGAGLGWGNGASSSIHAYIEGGGGVIENSGFTAMLIQNTGGTASAPELGLDLDQNNDGLDPVGGDEKGWRSNWTILDSIGVTSEEDETQYGRLYGAMNFSPAPTQYESGANFLAVGYEIELVARWGDSTGQTAWDWHATNLTNDPASGYTSGADYRQSGDPHPVGGVFDPDFFLESSHGVPYGTPLCDTLGETNTAYCFTGDANGDQTVDVEDLNIVLSAYGGSDATWQTGDFNLDGAVGIEDLNEVLSSYGQSLSVVAAVPEPTSLALATVAALALLGLWRLRCPT